MNIRRKRAESVFFYTFHKCASTLFGAYTLKRVKGLHHVDYAQDIYVGKITEGTEMEFAPSGCIYGPIRLSVDPGEPEYDLLVAPTSTAEFVRKRSALFLIRDPSDILVSSYYSFGFTHGFSPVPEVRQMQEDLQRSIQEKSIDEYVLEAADNQRTYFGRLNHLATVCERGTVLRYEDMINDFATFAARLCERIPLSKRTLNKMERSTRPRAVVDNSSHRRSGRVGGFRDSLAPSTISVLNTTLAAELDRFGYEA